MQPSQQNNQSNILELKSIFQLFDIDNTSEIDIKQINQIIRGLETLPAGANIQQLNFLMVDQVLTTPQPPQPTQQQQQVINLPPSYQNNSHGRRITLTKKFNSSENLEEAGKNYKVQFIQLSTSLPRMLTSKYHQLIRILIISQLLNLNNSQTIRPQCHFQISAIYLMNAWRIKINMKNYYLTHSQFLILMVRDILILKKQNRCLMSLRTKLLMKKSKVFNKQDLQQDVLKFCGVINDRMTLNEFKEFFKKNL